jgi:hypothetical protein
MQFAVTKKLRQRAAPGLHLGDAVVCVFRGKLRFAAYQLEYGCPSLPVSSEPLCTSFTPGSL